LSSRSHANAGRHRARCFRERKFSDLSSQFH
jgi:hypothetical protein